MKSWTKPLVLLAVLAGVAVSAAYGYGLYAVESAKHRAYAALDGVQLVRGAEALTASVVRRKVARNLARIGIRVRPRDVAVEIRPLDDENIRELSAAEQKAIAIARKLPHHRVQASILKVRVPLRVRRLLVTRHLMVARIFLVKGPAVPTGSEDEGDEPDEEGP